jgi:hypothetical protein
MHALPTTLRYTACTRRTTANYSKKLKILVPQIEQNADLFHLILFRYTIETIGCWNLVD